MTPHLRVATATTGAKSITAVGCKLCRGGESEPPHQPARNAELEHQGRRVEHDIERAEELGERVRVRIEPLNVELELEVHERGDGDRQRQAQGEDLDIPRSAHDLPAGRPWRCSRCGWGAAHDPSRAHA